MHLYAKYTLHPRPMGVFQPLMLKPCCLSKAIVKKMRENRESENPKCDNLNAQKVFQGDGKCRQWGWQVASTCKNNYLH